MERRIVCFVLVIFYKVDSIRALNQDPPAVLSADTLQTKYGLIEYAGLVSVIYASTIQN